MAIATFVTVPVCQMVQGAVVFIGMAVIAGCRRPPVYTVRMTGPAFCMPVLSDKRVPCPAVVEERRVPGVLGVALLTARTSELVQVWVCMALYAVAVDPFILTLDPMAVCAEEVVVYPF